MQLLWCQNSFLFNRDACGRIYHEQQLAKFVLYTKDSNMATEKQIAASMLQVIFQD